MMDDPGHKDVTATGRTDLYPLPLHVKTHRQQPRLLSVLFIVLWVVSFILAAPLLRKQAERTRVPLRQKHFNPENFNDIQGLTLISERVNVNRE